MSRRTIVAALLGVIAVALLGAWVYVQQTLRIGPLPTFNTTVTSAKPADGSCINRDGPVSIAIELIDLGNDVVYLAGGDNPVALETWATTRVRFPHMKNSTRHLLFDETCLFRSPGVDATCQGDACFTFVDLYEHTWFVLNAIAGQGCYPDPSGCSGADVKPGYVSITTIDKCQEIVFNGPVIYELNDGRGNRYVMHATSDGQPTTEGVPLPAGWTLTAREIDDPLVLQPRGEGHCYYNIVRDANVQSYHQVDFADAVFVPPIP